MLQLRAFMALGRPVSGHVQKANHCPVVWGVDNIQVLHCSTWGSEKVPMSPKLEAGAKMLQLGA